MIREEYFKKLEKRYLSYWYGVVLEEPSKVVELAKEIAKYTDEEGKVTRIIHGLWRGNIYSIEKLMKADINEIAKIKNIGRDASNILRQIKDLPTTTYADEHPFSKKKTKDEIIEQLEKLGYMYDPILWVDGTVRTYKFKCPDSSSDDCYWEVAIENHTEDDDKDWFIYVGYHNPNVVDWFGKQIDISGCIEFEAMKLIVEFTEILKKEKK